MHVYEHLDRNCQRVVVEQTREVKAPCPECVALKHPQQRSDERIWTGSGVQHLADSSE